MVKILKAYGFQGVQVPVTVEAEISADNPAEVVRLNIIEHGDKPKIIGLYAGGFKDLQQALNSISDPSNNMVDQAKLMDIAKRARILLMHSVSAGIARTDVFEANQLISDINLILKK